MEAARNTPRTLSDFIAAHPAFAATLFYGYASSLGLFYLWGLFDDFGINIMDFTQTGDFLTAALRHRTTFLLTMLSAPVITLPLVWIVVWLRRSIAQAGDGWRWAKVAGGVFAVLVLLAVLLFGSVAVPFSWGLTEADQIRSGHGQRVEFRMDTEAGSEVPGALAGQAALIAVTERYIFLYDLESDHTDIIPVSGLLYMTRLPEPSTSPCAASTPCPTATPNAHTTEP